MIKYLSTKGGVAPATFEEAVIQGFAADGGLFVPDAIPRVSAEQLASWSDYSYTDLAFEILSLYIDRSEVPEDDLRQLIEASFNGFESDDVVRMVPLEDGSATIMELFHGPTLSFKDVAMGFLMNVLDYFLQKRNEHLSIILATTGDTGPAAAWAAAGKKTIDCWPLYPRGMISEEQERQMTTLKAHNIYPIGVENCPNGGDDLDFVVAKLFENSETRKRFNLSSVNSINWCRVLVQSVHYFYGYFQVVKNVGDKIVYSVPTGAFGNLFGGYLARSMGLPVETFICANNENKALHTTFTTGNFAKKHLLQTRSSAIDIVAPYNFWRFLYFCTNKNSEKIKSWMSQFSNEGATQLDDATFATIQQGYLSASISDELTEETIRRAFNAKQPYLLDPHTAVAVAAATELKEQLSPSSKVVCLSTAHPAKFPEITRSVLEAGPMLPPQGKHASLIDASKVCQELRLCSLKHLEFALIDAMEQEILNKSVKDVL